MKINYRSFSLPFKYPFTISKGTKTHQPTLIVELEHFGIKGYGEAPAISYYNIQVEKMIADEINAGTLELNPEIISALDDTDESHTVKV